MENFSVFFSFLIPDNQLELIVAANTAVITVALFVVVVLFGSFLIVRNFRRNFIFEMSTFRENYEHEKMHWDHLQGELNAAQAKLNEFEKQKTDWSDERQHLLMTIAGLEEQVKNLTAQTTVAQDDIVIEYYMNQGTSPKSPDSAN